MTNIVRSKSKVWVVVYIHQENRHRNGLDGVLLYQEIALVDLTSERAILFITT